MRCCSEREVGLSLRATKQQDGSKVLRDAKGRSLTLQEALKQVPLLGRCQDLISFMHDPNPYNLTRAEWIELGSLAVIRESWGLENDQDHWIWPHSPMVRNSILFLEVQDTWATFMFCKAML